jgi:hypothetical protein
MMVEQGYGGRAVEMQPLKTRLRLIIKAVDLKTLHDKILSSGSPAPKYVKELMRL